MNAEPLGGHGAGPGTASGPGAAAHRTGRAEVSGGALEFDLFLPDAGGGDAPLVFLHGWTLDRRMWSPQFHAFPERPVIALDRRGCGASTAPHDLAAEPHDVLAVLDQLGFERCVLVGMSQAGQIAAELALAEPSRLAGLVLHGARLGPLAAGQTPDIPLGEYRSLVKSGRLPAMKARWREHALMRLVDTAWQAEVDAMLARYDGSDLREDVSARPPIAHERLRRLATPTLVIVGDRDTALRRKVARELACILPQARLSEIAGAGHMCNLCSANTYNTALGDFLESL